MSNYFLITTTKQNIYKQFKTIDFMKKIIKKYGSSHVIKLDPEDMTIYGLKEGDVVDISDIVILKKGGKKK